MNISSPPSAWAGRGMKPTNLLLLLLGPSVECEANRLCLKTALDLSSAREGSIGSVRGLRKLGKDTAGCMALRS